MEDISTESVVSSKREREGSDRATAMGRVRSYRDLTHAARVLFEQAQVAASFGQQRQASVLRASARVYSREALLRRLAGERRYQRMG